MFVLRLVWLLLDFALCSKDSQSEYVVCMVYGVDLSKVEWPEHFYAFFFRGQYILLEVGSEDSLFQS